jgi:hypothetical protein
MAALRLQANADLASAVSCPNTFVRVGHTHVDDLDATFAENVEQGQGAYVTVLDDATLSIPATGEGEFFDVPFDVPFDYNGVDNLVFEIARSAGCSATVAVRNQADVTYTSYVFSGSDANAPTGTTGTFRISSGFVFEGGTKILRAADGGVNQTVFGAPASIGRSQYLILPGDIEGAGPITGIEFEVSASLAAPMTTTYSLTLSHAPSDTNALQSDPGENVGTDGAIVAEGLTVTVPKGAQTFWLPLEGTFDYDGERPLLIDVTATAVTGPTLLQGRGVLSGRVNLADVDSDDGLVQIRAIEPRLRFHGSTVDRIFSSSDFDTYVFTTNATGRSEQYLYHATELGTAGAITRLGCRMVTASSTETDYADFEVSFAHTAAEELTVDMSANMPAPEAAFTGTFTVPAGLVQGDWIEIPLTTPFEYDGLRNLLVETRTSSGNAEHRCAVIEDSTRFPSRRAAGGNRLATTASDLLDQQRDVRLWIDK